MKQHPQIKQLTTYEYLYFHNCIECIFDVIGPCKKHFYIRCLTDEFEMLTVTFYDENMVIIPNIRAYGVINIDRNNNWYFALHRVENENVLYQHLGIATLILTALFKTLSIYENLYDVRFSYIVGTLGTMGNDTPQKSIPLYKKFDQFNFDELRKLHLNSETLNLKDREILYNIA